MTRYWAIWLAAMLATFAVPEFTALYRRRPQDTLSWWFWTRFQVVAHQPVREWSASHVLFAGVFLTLAVWLVAHLLLRMWT